MKTLNNSSLFQIQDDLYDPRLAGHQLSQRNSQIKK